MKKNTTLTKQELIRYTPSIQTGLSSIQVFERINSGLTNTVKERYDKTYANIFVNNICTFFNLLGLIVFVALLSVGAPIGDFFFTLFYISNITIGIIQEIKAKKCVDKLSIVANKTVKVVRDETLTTIMASEIVLDDIVYLGLGSQIPSDCVILDGEVEVNESLLTGESVAVKKHADDKLFAGSFITSGTCYAKVISVGKDNYAEILSSKAKKYKKPHSEIMNSLKLIIKAISFVIVPLTIAFLIKYLAIGGLKLEDAILYTSPVIIGMIPAGMFLLTSVALAVGIIRLAKHNTLVQDLYSLEMLARVNTICFDKTGTLTDGNMSVCEVKSLSDEKLPINDVMSSLLFALNDSNQTAIALNEYFGKNEIYKSKTTLPFNSSRKLSAVTFEDGKTFAFGAPEFVLSDSALKSCEKEINEYSKKGFRVLVLASSNNTITDDKLPDDFTPLCLIIISDNIRKESIDTVKWFNENGVDIKVISGDNPITVSEVAKRVGIIGAEKYVSLEGLTEEEVFKVATEYTVFGRVSPDQKAIIISALKKAGKVTAMTGDGVNDILAMKESDCAISVANGSEAAHSVSHIILLDNNFNSMPQVVYEGRRVINNVQYSSTLFLMKTMFTMLMGLITLFLFERYPYRLSNMIMFEVFIIGIPTFFLSFQPNDSIVQGKFIRNIITRSIPSALTMIISVLAVEILFSTVANSNPELKNIYTTMGIFVLTYAGLINLFKTCYPLNKFRSFIFFTSFTVILGISIYSIIFGLDLFMLYKFTPIEKYVRELLIVLIITIIDIPLSILFDKIFKKINKS